MNILSRLFPINRPIHVVAYHKVISNYAHPAHNIDFVKNYYKEIIKKQANWIYSGIYLDDGSCRAQYKIMIEDAKAKKFDLIITQSMSCLSRNLLDCLAITRELLHLKKPVGIYFENIELCTLLLQSELMLRLTADIAKLESENKGNYIKHP